MSSIMGGDAGTGTYRYNLSTDDIELGLLDVRRLIRELYDVLIHTLLIAN